jgi:hypothetical protein
VKPARVRAVPVSDGWHALALLRAAVAADDPRDLLEYRSPQRRTPEDLHAFVLGRVRYLQGGVQRWATPERTLTGGYGDCGNSSRALIALARLEGYSARLRAFTKVWQIEPGPIGRTFVAPAHVAAQIFDPRAASWRWAETTLPAHYGEHPLVAAARLGIMTTLKETDPSDETLVPVAPAALPTPPGIGALEYPSTPGQVPSTKTPVTPESMFEALSQAWIATFGTEPQRASILVLLAQWGIETANGASMIQFNVGNFKHVAGDGWSWSTFETTECDADGTCTPQEASFAAYPDLEIGVAVYFHAMVTRWKAAWPAVVAGDTLAFAKALKTQGYYTAPLAQYAAGLAARFAYFDKQITSDPSVPLTALPIYVLGLSLAAAGAYYATTQGWLPSDWYAPLVHPLRYLRMV